MFVVVTSFLYKSYLNDSQQWYIPYLIPMPSVKIPYLQCPIPLHHRINTASLPIFPSRGGHCDKSRKLEVDITMSVRSVVLLTSIALLAGSFVWFHARQPTAYMDELFHVPQAGEICHALLTSRIPHYSSAITTPPGLYLPNAVLALFLRIPSVCSISPLRLSSALFALFCLPLIISLIRALAYRLDIPSIDTDVVYITAFVIWLHPVFLFYAHLFYTDPPAVFWLLLSWRLALAHHIIPSALIALFATLTRQTNLIWHMFIVGDQVLHSVACKIIFSSGRHDRLHFHCIVSRLSHMLWQNVAHVIVGAMYIIFLVWNNGPALGDRDNHTVTMHHVMLPYLFGFHAVSYLPFQLACPQTLLRSITRVAKSPMLLTVTVAMTATTVALVQATGSWAHPFILSDNRHFIFYLHRRWLGKSIWHRLMFLPLYIWTPVSICLDFLLLTERPNISLKQKQLMQVEWIGDVFLFLCAALTLLPTPLLEPRYFVPANMLLCIRRAARNHHPPMQRIAVIAVGLLFVNLALVFVFAEMPFTRPPDSHMPDDHSLGRFMF